MAVGRQQVHRYLEINILRFTNGERLEYNQIDNYIKWAFRRRYVFPRDTFADFVYRVHSSERTISEVGLGGYKRKVTEWKHLFFNFK